MPQGTPARTFKCLKYSLMVINSFGVIIGVLVVMFGFAYPEENFPGGNTGKETAMFAIIFIFFSLIGYCGAVHQKLFFLIPYVAVICLGMIYSFFKWATNKETTCLNAKSYSILFISGLFVLLMALALLLAHRIRKSNAASTSESNDSLEKSNFGRSTSASFISIPKFAPKK